MLLERFKHAPLKKVISYSWLLSIVWDFDWLKLPPPPPLLPPGGVAFIIKVNVATEMLQNETGN